MSSILRGTSIMRNDYYFLRIVKVRCEQNVKLLSRKIGLTESLGDCEKDLVLP